jgi:Dyp-type peroxidase family
MRENTQHVTRPEATAACVKLASQMVGRWPSGAPLVLSPNSDDPKLAEMNDFLYAQADSSGAKCPMGSHVRRTNPRDVFTSNPREAILLAKRHRLIRRGRPYGPPLAASLNPADYLKPAPEDPKEDRGLYFIGINGDLSRQFEFIQQTWINNPKFAGLYNDADPLMGDHFPPGKGVFTIQGDVRERVTNIRRFVHVRGGAYFFMPGLRAVRYLARLHPANPK